jgi:hypothetical protein
MKRFWTLSATVLPMLLLCQAASCVTLTITAKVTAPGNGAQYIQTSANQYISVTCSSSHTYKITNGASLTTYHVNRQSTLSPYSLGTISGQLNMATDVDGTSQTFTDTNSGSRGFHSPDGVTQFSLTATSHIGSADGGIAIPNDATDSITFSVYYEG